MNNNSTDKRDRDMRAAEEWERREEEKDRSGAFFFIVMAVLMLVAIVFITADTLSEKGVGAGLSELAPSIATFLPMPIFIIISIAIGKKHPGMSLLALFAAFAWPVAMVFLLN